MNRPRTIEMKAVPAKLSPIPLVASSTNGAAARRKLARGAKDAAGDLAALRAENNALRAAIDSAAQMQRRICARRILRRGRFEIANDLFPVHDLSGDFSQVLDLEGAVGIALGDIAGKGIQAGMWLPHLVGLIRLCVRHAEDPAEGVAAINRELLEFQPEPPISALFFGRLDTETGDFRYCNAGQPAALLVRRDGAVLPLRQGGPILGALEESSFDSGSVRIGAGDLLVCFSDGLVESRNARDEEFGLERVVEAVLSAGRPSASTLLYSVLGAVQDFVGSRPRIDDYSLTVVRGL